eukprot:187232-Pyramimonas_sp.AAC.5
MNRTANRANPRQSSRQSQAQHATARSGKHTINMSFRRTTVGSYLGMQVLVDSMRGLRQQTSNGSGAGHVSILSCHLSNVSILSIIIFQKDWRNGKVRGAPV